MNRFKNCYEEDSGNYVPFSVLQCFSKIHEEVMYNRLYKHLTMKDTFYEKELGC